MAYDINLVQLNTNTFGLHSSSGYLGFPAGNFRTLLYSQWVCGPTAVPPTSPANFPSVGPAFAGFFNLNLLSSPQITLFSSAPGSSHDPFYSGTFPFAAYNGVRCHMLMSVDTQANIVQLYINDSPVTLTGSWTGAAGTNWFYIDPVGSFWLWDVSAVIAAGQYPAIADIWSASPPAFVDLSITANRRKFINTDLTPVYLGADGSAPMGTQPAIYCTMQTGGLPTDILHNLGTGGTTFTYAGSAPTLQAPGSCTLPPPPPPPGVKTVTDAELYFQPTGTFVDFTDGAMRRRFVGDNGGAQYLGHSGELPFGTAPAIYLTAQPGNPDSFATNNGVGGTFTIFNGDLTLADFGPACTDRIIKTVLPGVENPTILLSTSDDGGRTWRTLKEPRGMGRIGEYRKRVRWLKMGHYRQRLVKIEMVDPVRRNIIGVYIDQIDGLS